MNPSNPSRLNSWRNAVRRFRWYISHIAASPSKATTYFHNSLKTHAPAAWLVGYWHYPQMRHELCYGALGTGVPVTMPRRTQPLTLEMTAMSAPTANDQFGFSLGDLLYRFNIRGRVNFLNSQNAEAPGCSLV